MSSSNYRQCSSCGQLAQIETCFDCNQQLCVFCRTDHFKNWKAKAAHEADNVQRSLAGCRAAIEQQIDPLFTKNQAQLIRIEEQIEQNYRVQLEKLNREKDSLMSTVKDLKRENDKFTLLKANLNAALANLMQPRNMGDDISIARSLLQTHQQTLEAAKRANSDFDAFRGTNSSIKIIDRFEDVSPASLPSKLLGSLVIRDQKIAATADYSSSAPVAIASMNYSSLPPPSQAAAPLAAQLNLPASGSLNRLKNLLQNGNSLKKEIPFKEPPLQFCSYRNLVFVAIESKKIFVYETTTTDYMIEKNQVDIELNAIVGLACNSSHLAVSYCSPDSKVKAFNKKLPKNGVVIFKRDGSIVQFERAIERDDFLKPKGLAMTDAYLYVCDFEKHFVYKFEIKSGIQVQEVNFYDEQPYKISVNANYAVLTELKNHTVGIYDVNTFKLLLKKKIEPTFVSKSGKGDEQHGPYDVQITSDNTILVKNHLKSSIVLLDMQLAKQFEFVLKNNILITSFSLVEFQSNPILAVGCYDSRYFRIACYSE